MFLFFDTETTGLPQRWNAPVTNVDNWPRLVQLAWIMCDDKGNIIEERSDIIKPEGFSIPVEASRVHGITTIKAQEEGKDLLSILELFSDKIDAADALIGHNISFDECIGRRIRTETDDDFFVSETKILYDENVHELL